MSKRDLYKERKGFYKTYKNPKQKTSEELIEIQLNRASILMNTTPAGTKEYFYHSGEVMALRQVLKTLQEYKENGLLL